MSRNHQKQPSKHSTQSDSPTGLDLEAKPLFKYAYDKYKSQKPKRNKSAFLLFSTEKRALLKSNGENLNSNQIMTKLAELWNNISLEEREKYEFQAIEEKKRYLQELDVFQKENPSVGKFHNRTRKNHIKKPSSAYGLFLKEVSVVIKKENPELLMADILKIVSEKWKNLDECEKQKYQDEALREKNKSQAQQLEKVSKRVKIEPSPMDTPNLNDHSSYDTYYKQEEVSEASFIPQETMRRPPYGIIVNDLLPTLSSYISSQFDLVLVPKANPHSVPFSQTQKPMFLLPSYFRDSSGEFIDAQRLRSISTDGFRTPSDVSTEMPRLNINPLSRNDSSAFGFSSINQNSNQFSSFNNRVNPLLSGTRVNPARQEALNNVLLNSLSMNDLM